MTTTANPGLEFVRQLGEDLANNEFDLPPFPDSALRIQEALKDPDVTIDALGDIVLSEPALAGRLLSISNSAAMAGRMEITDIRSAISRLGLDMVQNVAVAFAAREAFKAPEGSLLQNRLNTIRKHCVAVSVLAYVLAKQIQSTAKADEAMLAGLLHAIGKFYIFMQVENFPELFSDEATLDELLSTWHTGVGRAIVESWGFPEKIATAVDEHETTDRSEFGTADLTDLVLVANLAIGAGILQDASPAALEELEGLVSLKRMNIDVETLQDIVREQNEDILSLIQAMSG